MDMLYHYTSLGAFKSILRDARTRSQICFWATRYDCFADKEELKLGIDTIKRLLPQVEKDLQPDRRIAAKFDWSIIEGNTNLPFPYIVSFTSRPNNEYMWNEYAKNNGVVLEIDDTQPEQIPDVPLLRLASCIYVDEESDVKIVEMIRQEYTNMGYGLLSGPHKEFALGVLSQLPHVFVNLIAMAMLSFVAPRIKGAKDYCQEEETRAIISLPKPAYNSLVGDYKDAIIKTGLFPSNIFTIIENECSRYRSDGRIVYYRELHLPVKLLKGVFVRRSESKKAVESLLKEMGLLIPLTQI